MNRMHVALGLGSLVVAAAMLGGCSGSSDQDTKLTSQPTSSGGEDAKIREALAKLSAEDRALAEAQGTCPVGNGPLGAMGTPPIVEVKGRKVFICCEGCRDSLESDPDKYLAKLDKKGK